MKESGLKCIRGNLDIQGPDGNTSMNITILGTESLGVRGLCCKVTVRGSAIVIDPGVALGYRRHGFLPHPVQVARGEDVGRTIIAALKDATDVVISHYHGDHVPLPDANPYQLNLHTVAPLLKNVRIWAQGRNSISRNMQSRSSEISTVLQRSLPTAEGKCKGILVFHDQFLMETLIPGLVQ